MYPLLFPLHFFLVVHLYQTMYFDKYIYIYRLGHSFSKLMQKAPPPFVTMDVAHSDFFWAKSRQMATQFSENGIFCRKFLRKKFAKKRQKTGFFGDGVTTFMATGYSFQSFLKYIRQLSRNLPRCSPLWLHQETGKKKHWLHMFLHNGTICSYQVPYFVNAHLFFQ